MGAAIEAKEQEEKEKKEQEAKGAAAVDPSAAMPTKLTWGRGTSRESTSVSSSAPKSNPFGSAKAVDTASKLAAIEAKEKEEKDRKKKDQDEKNAAVAKEKAKEAPL